MFERRVKHDSSRPERQPDVPWSEFSFEERENAWGLTTAVEATASNYVGKVCL